MKRSHTPSKSYKKLQADLRAAIVAKDKSGHRTKLEKSLEKMFMAAWGFTRDRLRRSYRLEGRLPGGEGLDHRYYYTGPDEERVIVTQPYGNFVDKLRKDLTLSTGDAPEVIEASEWAFYYPGEASLVILIFSCEYVKALEKCGRARVV